MQREISPSEKVQYCMNIYRERQRQRQRQTDRQTDGDRFTTQGQILGK